MLEYLCEMFQNGSAYVQKACSIVGLPEYYSKTENRIEIISTEEKILELFPLTNSSFISS